MTLLDGEDQMSKICLGTVQFGMRYGINNKSGKLDKKHIFEIFDYALEKGIDYFDTARVYGDSENLIGEYLEDRKASIKIITKLVPDLLDKVNYNIEDAVVNELGKSLKKMRIDFIHGFLLHNPEHFCNSKVLKGLIKCKELGLVEKIGVSIYEPEHAIKVVESGLVDYIQVPFSIFDQRLDEVDFFIEAKINGVSVFARSLFLQGLLLMKQEQIPDYLTNSVCYLDRLDRILKKYSYSRLKAAFLFAYQNPLVDYVVVGVDNINQLKEITKITEQGLADSLLTELRDSFRNVDPQIISPNRWGNKEGKE